MNSDQIIKKLLPPVSLVMMVLLLQSSLLFSQDNKKEELDNLLNLSLKELMDLTVTTAGKKEEKIGDIPASVVIITRSEIEKYGYRDIPEILQSIPGFYLIDDLFAKNMGIRGFWNSTPNRNMILLVNGIPQNEDAFSYTFIDGIKISPQSIDRIEIIKGPMSIMYGSGAFLAAVNIITNDVSEKESNNILSGSIGSFNSKNIALRTAAKADDLQYTFNGTYFQTDGPEYDIGKMGGANRMGTKNYLGDESIYFNFSGKFKKLRFDYSFSKNKKETLFAFPPTVEGNGFPSIVTANRFSLEYHEPLSDKISLKSRLSFFSQRWEMFQEDWVYDGYYGTERDISEAMSVELNVVYKPNDKLNLIAGVNYYNIFNDQIHFIHPDFNYHNFIQRLADGESRISKALFTQVDYKLSDKFLIVGGVRLEQMPPYRMAQHYNLGYEDEEVYYGTYDNSTLEVISRLAMIYSPDNSNFFKFIYGTAINQPSFFQNADLVDVRRNLGNSLTLNPERIQTYELNYIGKITAKSSLNISLFRNLLNKLIYRTLIVDNQDVAISYHENTGKMVTNGLELNFQYNPFNKLNFSLSATYQQTEDKRSEEHSDFKSAYSPHLLLYLKASYFFNENISLALTSHFVDKMSSYWDNTLPNEDGSYGRYLGEEVSDYYLVNANLRIRNILGSKAFISFYINNILNHEFRYPTSVSNNWATKGTLGIGRNYELTLGWKF